MAVLEAELRELRARHHAERTTDQVKAQITLEEIATATAALARAREQIGDVIVRSPAHGSFVTPRPADLVGRFVEQGDLIGHVVGSDVATARVVVPQSDIALVRDRTEAVEVRLSGRVGRALPAVISRAGPGAHRSSAQPRARRRGRGPDPRRCRRPGRSANPGDGLSARRGAAAGGRRLRDRGTRLRALRSRLRGARRAGLPSPAPALPEADRCLAQLHFVRGSRRASTRSAGWIREGWLDRVAGSVEGALRRRRDGSRKRLEAFAHAVRRQGAELAEQTDATLAARVDDLRQRSSARRTDRAARRSLLCPGSGGGAPDARHARTTTSS